MLKLNLTFHLSDYPQTVLLGSRCVNHRPQKSEVVLSGLSISIETAGRNYQVISDLPPEPDRPGASDGLIWPCCLLSLPGGASIEQQMMLPATGNAAAISWRLRGRAESPVILRASPLFRVPRPAASTSFAIEPEVDGERLAWCPFLSSSKIFADTNGRLVKTIGRAEDGITPGSFEFVLCPRPALLIFGSETCHGTNVNPLLGGFLARLAPERTKFAAPGPPLQPIAA